MGKSLNIFANTEKNEYLRASCNATRVYFKLCSPNDSNTDICVYIVYFVITSTQRIEKSLHIIRVLIRCIQTIGRSIGLRHVRFTFILTMEIIIYFRSFFFFLLLIRNVAKISIYFALILQFVVAIFCAHLIVRYNLCVC